MIPGDSFAVRDGNIRIPEGGYICLWALQNLLPVVVLKERQILEEAERDWVWRVHHVQCPDPEGGVVFEIARTAEVAQDLGQTGREVVRPSRELCDATTREEGTTGRLQDLRVVVEEVRGKCTSGMMPGDHFCLYALHAALPMLPAKQRLLPDGDWMKDAHHIMCPDPAGNVLMRIEPFA